MNSQEIISKFISKGFQLNLDSLKFFTENQEKIDFFIDEFEKLPKKPTTITKEDIYKILETTKSEVKVIENFQKQEKVLTASEVAQISQNQFEKIKKFLLNRIDLPNPMSINKISDKLKDFSIIARVSEINGNKILLEDLTGQVTATIANQEIDSNLLIEGETAGFVCSNTERGLQIKKIVWPDIQFKKEVTKGGGKIIFSHKRFSNLIVKKENLQDSIKIFLGENDIELEKNSEKKELPDPCIIEINGVKIFLSNGENLANYRNKLGETAAKVILNLVRKRLIFSPTYFGVNFVLEDVPDIFVVDSFGEAEVITYKGTTFLSLGDSSKEKIAWLVDLQSRENVKIDLE